MIIKEAVVQKCEKCGRYEKEISPEQRSCDRCKKPITPYKDNEKLEIIVFYKSEKTKCFYFCSWACVFKFAAKIKTDSFFILPYVRINNKISGRRTKDFQKLVKKL